MRFLIFLLIGCWGCLPAAAQSVTWYVSATHGDDIAHNGTGGWDQAYATIIKAVNSSVAGATILVSNGTYVLSGTPITVGDRRISGFSGNPADTIVSGGGTMRCFLLNHSNSFVDGMTLTNGLAVEATIGGGGAHISAGGTVSNCWIVGNIGASMNAASVYGGGGVLISGTGGTLLNSLIAGNVSSNDGGGVMVRMASGPVLVRDCVISNNSAARYGGGMMLYGASSVNTAETSVIANNIAGYSGGGIYNGGAVVSGCRILNNTAVTNGGGTYMLNALSITRNCLIAGNAVTAGVGINMGGGGVNIFNAGHLVNCTIASNTANTNAGGIMYYSQTAGNVATVSNTIVGFNTATGVNSNWYAANVTYKHNLSFYNCCLMPTNGLPGSSAGNIDADPLFVDNAGDYRLQRASPCVNAGINQDWMALARDVDGRLRLDRFSGRVDMGCHEYVLQGALYYMR